MDAAEQVKKFEEVLEGNYKAELSEQVRKGLDYILIDFAKLSEVDPDVANIIPEDPDNVFKFAQSIPPASKC